MKEEFQSPTLLPILRSATQGMLLAWLFAHPGREFSQTQLSELVAVSGPTVGREVARLREAGLVTERAIGPAKPVSINELHPLYLPISQIVLRTFGVAPVLEERFGAFPGVEAAFIYGSWAARLAGEPGGPPSDVDVLVVGSVNRSEVFVAAAEEAGRTLGVEVNVQRVSSEHWAGRHEDAFLSGLLTRPLYDLRTRRITVTADAT